MDEGRNDAAVCAIPGIIQKESSGMLRIVVALILAGTMSAPAHAQTAPAGLRGKSVIVSWIETRSLRVGDETSFRNTQTPFSRSLYISSAGRPFTRTTATPGRRSGSAEAVGASGQTHSGGARQVQFHGRSIVMTGASRSGGARRVQIDFNEGFSNCNAHVIVGFEAGKTIKSKSLASGKPMEVRSSTVSGTTCTVRDGNVFGE
jgi:hypothetical protein